MRCGTMKYLITKKQYQIISEALGVPDSILDAAEEFYDIFSEKINTITTKKDKYSFRGDVDITLGGKTKIMIDKYSLDIEIVEIEDFDDTAKISSMGMMKSFRFDREIFMKRVLPSNNAEFSMKFVVNPNWEPRELYNEFVQSKDDNISALAHELKHKYDNQVKEIGLLGVEAEYAGIKRVPNFNIPIIDNKFKYYLYFTDVAENLVRATEIASQIKSKDIPQSEFIDFLKKNETFRTLVEIRNFTFEDFISGIKQNMDVVDEIMVYIKKDPNNMSEIEKITDLLKLLYINIGSSKMEMFNDYIKEPMDDLFGLFSLFGGQISKKEKNVNEIREKFYKHVSKYENRPLDFFKDEFKKFHIVANQMIRKLSKLYAMTHNKTTNESILNWELHLKTMDKKYGKKKIVTEINYKKKL